MSSDESRGTVFALVTVGACLLALSLLAVGTGGAAATPHDGNTTNTTLTDTVSETTDAVNDTVSETTDTVSDTTDTVTDTVSETTDTVADATDSTTADAVSDTVSETTDTVSETTDAATDTVSNTTTQTTEATANTTDSTSLLTVDSSDTLLSTESGDTPGDTDDGSAGADDGAAEERDRPDFREELADVAGALTGGVEETTTTAVSGVADTTDTVVGDDGVLTTVGDTVVTGASLSTTGDTSLANLDDPSGPTESEPTDDVGTVAPADGTPPAPPAPGTEPAAVDEPTTPAAGEETPVGTLEALVSRPLSGSVPVSGQAAAGAGLAVGAAAAAGTVALRGSSFAGSGLGRNTARLVRHGGPRAVRQAGAGVLDRLFRMATLFRYSRYDDSDPLENEARQSVMTAVEADPGRPITEVAEAADVNLSTARYHVRVLQQEDMLMRVPVRGRKRLFPAFTQDPELLAALSDEATAPIVDALERFEPATVGAIAEELDKSPSTVTHHLQRLEEDGVVVRERDGRSVKNSLAPAAREALSPSPEAEAESTPTAQSAD